MYIKPYFIFLLLLMCSFATKAQDPGIEYFAKVPSRYKVPGLAPMKYFKISYLNTVASKWVKNSLEMQSDIYRYKFNYRFSVIASAGLYTGAKRQTRDMYEISSEKGKETVNYYAISPLLNLSCSYAFYYPFFLRAGMGMYSNYEIAKYVAEVPQQVSGSLLIETNLVEFKYNLKNNSGYKPYYYIELYRPFSQKANGNRRLGFCGGTYFWPKNEIGKKYSINVGLYWSTK